MRLKNKVLLSLIILGIIFLGAVIFARWWTWSIPGKCCSPPSTLQLYCTELDFAILDVDKNKNEIMIDNKGYAKIMDITFRIWSSAGVENIEVSDVTKVIGGLRPLPAYHIGKYILIETPDKIPTDATKVEAIATIEGEGGNGTIVCEDNIQTFSIEK